jgi:hypothetical protein
MPESLQEDRPQYYRIRVKGHLDKQWSEWFYGMQIVPGEGETILSGSIRDQAALHGILMKVRDLGLPLISVDRVEKDADRDVPDSEKGG